MRIVSAYLIGVLFGIGIAVSGMANPAKVLNFFDVAGAWDPSLIFVMGGALVTALLGYRLVLARPGPLLEPRFELPARGGSMPRCSAGRPSSASAGVSRASARVGRCRRSVPDATRWSSSWPPWPPASP